LAGQEFELVGYAHTWGEHRVFYREARSERVRSLPAAWTDVVEVDAVVALAEGRSLFRVEDLRALVELVRRQTNSCVSEIMP
jgi:hypothetical protein